MTEIERPAQRPERPYFSSGPTVKRPGWSPENLSNAVLGRSHRSREGKAALEAVLTETREFLNIPEDYRVGIVPASDTGAFEMAMWSLLGPRAVDCLAWESFGAGWVGDIVKQLKLDNARLIEADYGDLPDLSTVDPANDLVFTWNGTTSGVRVPNGEWISDDREGLVLCDATSAIFAQDLPFLKLDVVTFSWQKVLGGEAAHGMIILSPRAVERLENHMPAWPMPKIFRLTSGGKLTEGIFTGATINTPSMLCVEDYLDALRWARTVGGLRGMIERADANANAIFNWIDRTSWIANLTVNPANRSNTSVCLKIVDPDVLALSDSDQAAFAKAMAGELEAEGVAFDIGSYRDAPPGLRIWCGGTVEQADIEALLPWLDWVFARQKLALKKAA